MTESPYAVRFDTTGIYDKNTFQPGFPIWMYLKPLQARNLAHCNSMRPSCVSSAWKILRNFLLVSEETLDEHVAALCDQLGVFYDYVQTVPYIGYRFKA